MDLELQVKVAAITSGSEGIDRVSAFRFCEEGARVVICARRDGVLRTIPREIESATGEEVLAVRAAVTDPADCERFINARSNASGAYTSWSIAPARQPCPLKRQTIPSDALGV